MIENNEDGWQEMLPEGIAKLIEDKNLFCHNEDSQEETRSEDFYNSFNK